MRTAIHVLLLSVCIIGFGCRQNRAPAIPGAPVGPDVGLVGVSLDFRVATTDPESDSVRYRLDWGNAISDWTPFIASAESCSVGHTWTVRDTYAVRVQAQDIHEKLSDWSPSHVVSVESLCRR